MGEKRQSVGRLTYCEDWRWKVQVEEEGFLKVLHFHWRWQVSYWCSLSLCCPPLSLYLSVFLSLSLSICLSFCLSLSLYLSVFLSLSICLSFCLSLSLLLPLCQNLASLFDALRWHHLVKYKGRASCAAFWTWELGPIPRNWFFEQLADFYKSS